MKSVNHVLPGIPGFRIAEFKGPSHLPVSKSPVSARFFSSGDDHIDLKADLNELVMKDPSSTIFAQVKDASMKDAGIQDGDVLVIDTAAEPAQNTMVVARIAGEFAVKMISKIGNKLFLLPKNADYRPLEITDSMDFQVWGVVTYVLKKK